MIIKSAGQEKSSVQILTSHISDIAAATPE